MRPTRKIVAEFAGVFLFGTLAGGILGWTYASEQYLAVINYDPQIPFPRLADTTLNTFMSRTGDNPDSILARMNKKYTDDYHLSPEEMTRIEPVLKEMSQNIYQVRHQFGVDIMTTLDKYHSQIADQLNPDHRMAYLSAMAERRQKLSSLLLLDQGSPTATSK